MERRKGSFLFPCQQVSALNIQLPLNPEIKTLTSRKTFSFCLCISKYHLYLLFLIYQLLLSLTGSLGGKKSFTGKVNVMVLIILQGDTHILINLVLSNKTDCCPSMSREKCVKQNYIHTQLKNGENDVLYFLYTMFSMAHYNA